MLFGRKPRRTIIVHADDEPDIRLVIQAALAPLGIDVVSAANGEEGLRLAVKEKPDLVLLDILMPGMDGFAVCAALREHPDHRDTPIVMLTALSQVKDVERSATVGATGYMIKPVDVARLRHKIIELLGPPSAS